MVPQTFVEAIEAAVDTNSEDHGHDVGDIAAPKIDASKIDAPKIDEGVSEPAGEDGACAAAGPAASFLFSCLSGPFHLSFVLSFVRSFVCSFVHSSTLFFVFSFLLSLVRSFVCSFVHSLFRSFVRLFFDSTAFGKVKEEADTLKVF